MREILYGQNSVVIAGVLLVTLVAAVEIGHRIGRGRAARASEAVREHIGTIQASLLGVLALLLGFSFSLALQRFDGRSEAVVDEANAIGTAYLRSHLLPASVRSEAQTLLRQYLDVRVQSAAIALSQTAERQQLLARGNRLLDSLWVVAARAVEEDKSPATSGLFIQALNDTIDAYGRRDASLNRHVPELILLLLFATFAATGAVVGYSAGLATHRPSLVAYLLVALIVVVAFVIIDLDRPRRGLIRVDVTSLTSLQGALHAAQTGGGMENPPAVTGHR